MRAITALLLFLVATTTFGQGIILVGPDTPVQPKDFVQILVSGLEDSQLPAARVEWTPTNGVTLIPARTWGGQPFLWFSSRAAGKFTITVTVNGWRKSVDAAVSDVTKSGIAASEFKTAAAALAAQYPMTSGNCVLEVAGENPPPPPPPVVGPRRILLIRESGDQTPQLGALIVRLQTNPYFKEKKHDLQVLDPQGKLAGTETAHPAIVQALKDLGATKLPAVAVYSADSGKLVGVAECPLVAEEFLALVKKFGG